MREFWAVGEKEHLSAETADDAICEYVEFADESKLPDTVTAVQFQPMAVSTPDEDDVLEYMLESLDQEYGDPDGDPYDPTPVMKIAAKDLCEIIQKEYVSWNCEPSGVEETVNVKDWIKARWPAGKT